MMRAGIKNPINILSFSDIHFFSKTVPTKHIANNLLTFFPDTPEMSEIDIVFLAGDIFEEAVLLNSDLVPIVLETISIILQVCKKRNIILRVLEGTRFHDRKQSRQFEVINKLTGHGVNLKYIEILDIEYISELDVNILYVPDEWRGNHKQTENEVIELLKEKELTHVDFSIMHGFFGFQSPPPTHDAAFYLHITKRYVFIGHDHLPNKFDRILVHGSFDRLKHGEEHAKGFYKVTSYKDTINDVVKFIENKNAAVFKTLDIIDLDESHAKEYIDTYLNSLNYNNNDVNRVINIRLVFKKNSGHEHLYNFYKRNYIRIKWQVVISDEEKDQNNIFIPKIYNPVPINENSVINLVKKRIELNDYSEQIKNKVIDILNDIKGKVK